MTTSKHSDGRRYEDETLLDSVATRKRYGGKSPMWLRRRQANPNFPKPVYVGIYPFFRLGELRRWEDGLPTTAPASQVALGAAGVDVLKEARQRKQKAGAAPPAKPSARKPSRSKVAAE
jgi:hypothetical protein